MIKPVTPKEMIAAAKMLANPKPPAPIDVISVSGAGSDGMLVEILWQTGRKNICTAASKQIGATEYYDWVSRDTIKARHAFVDAACCDRVTGT